MRLFKRVSLCLSLAAVGFAVAQETDFLDSVLQKSVGARTQIIPDRFLRSWDPVTVFFTSEKGPKAGAPEDRPERFVSMSPDHPGAWTWIDTRTLQFRPAEPWPPLQSFNFTADGRVVDVATLFSPPTGSEPSSGEHGLDPVQSISLTFKAPIPPSLLARVLTIELRSLPGLQSDDAQLLTSADFTIKAFERANLSDEARYAVQLNQPIPLGTRATLRFLLSTDRADQSQASLEFTTREAFTLSGLRCGSNALVLHPDGTQYPASQPLQCGSTPSFTLTFTEQIGNFGPLEGKNLIGFEPNVKNVQYIHQGRAIVVSGDFEREKAYRVILSPTPIVDTLGRHLQLNAPSELSLSFSRSSPRLAWESGIGIVERFGPQMLPLSGQGYERADLRIYKIDPFNRNFWPFSLSPIRISEENEPPTPGYEANDWSTTNKRLSPYELKKRLVSLGSPAYSDLVMLPLSENGAGGRFGLDLSDALTQISGRSQPGTYLVGLRTLNGSPKRAWTRLQVTDLNLTTVEEPDRVQFFVTSLSTGAPVSGATLRIDGVSGQDFTTLYSGKTGADGRLEWVVSPSKKQVRRIAVQKSTDTLVLDATAGPEIFSDNLWRPARYNHWLNWVYNSTVERGEAPHLLGHLFSDRPIYKPGESVHFKGYLRWRENGTLSLASGPGSIIVRGPGSQEWRLPAAVNERGSFYATFNEDAPPTGYYSAYYAPKAGGRYGQMGFQIESYKLPTFDVKLHSADAVPLDAPFDVTLSASYFAGGQVSGRPVRWRVTQFPSEWSPSGHPGFSFSSDGRFSRADRFRSTPALSRVDTTSSAGDAHLIIDPSLELTAQPRTYIVEATVTGADESTVTQTDSIQATPAFALGLKLDRYVPDASEIRPKIIVVGGDNTLIAGQPITLRLKKRSWHSRLQVSDFSTGEAKYLTDVVDELVSETSLKSLDAVLTHPLPIEGAGVYLVEIEAQDRLGRSQRVQLDLYAGGTEALSWSKPKAGVFNVSTDQKSYKPGDVAHLVIQSPYQSGQALAVVERPTGNDYRWIPIRGGKAELALTIKEGWTPKLPVHFVLHRSRGHNGKAHGLNQLDLSRPATVANTTWLTIQPVENQLQVTLSHPKAALPGADLPVTISLKTPSGRPQSGEVTLWMVDRAILTLAKEQRIDPLPDFIRARGSYVAIRDTRNLTLGHIPFSEMPGGDGISLAGKSASPMDSATVRKNFKPLAYYKSDILVGPSGETTVHVKMPDNLTVFAVRAKATSGAARFGSKKAQIAVRLPLIVQPALPRFVRSGDQFELTGVGRVVEGEGGAGQAQVAVEGLTLLGASSKKVSWPEGDAQPIRFNVQVPHEQGGERAKQVKIKLAVSRSSDGASDAFEVSLPQLSDREPIVTRHTRALSANTAVTLKGPSVAIRPGSLTRTALFSTEPGVLQMAAAMDALLYQPSCCTEQRLSRARAFLALSAIHDVLGLNDSSAQRRAGVQSTLNYLPEVIDALGRVSNWRGDEGSLWLTASALNFITEAEHAGLAVDSGVKQTLIRTLKQGLRSDYRHWIDGAAWWERTVSLQALAYAGESNDADVNEMLRRSDTLKLEARARVVTAASLSGMSEKAAVQDAAASVSEGIYTRLNNGKTIYAGLEDGATGLTALIVPSESRTLAQSVRALVKSGGDDPKLPLMIDALIGVGGTDGWGQSNANAEAILALSSVLNERVKPASVSFSVNGDASKQTIAPGRPIARWSADHSETLLIQSDTDGVFLHQLRYLPARLGSEEAPAANGFAVTRTLYSVGEGPMTRHSLGGGGERLSFEVGQVVEDQVQWVNTEERHFVAIRVPLAAGMEPLNPALATAPPEATPSVSPSIQSDYTEFLDDSVTYYFTTMSKGTFHVAFRTRATTVGRFQQPAARAQMLYSANVNGNSAGALIEVLRP